MPAKTVIQTRRDTAANWASANPTLAAGEWGLETDTGLTKIGDGTTAWNTRDYFASFVPALPMRSNVRYRQPGGTNENFSLAQDLLYYSPFYVDRRTTFSEISCYSGSTFSGTATVRLGIYANVNGDPSTLILDAGTISATAASTGYAITITQTLNRGWYSLAIVNQSAANIFASRVNATGQIYWGQPMSTNHVNNIIGRSESGISGALPSSVGTLSNVSSAPHVWLRTS